jgi:uncharacterized protein (DUF305 family)
LVYRAGSPGEILRADFDREYVRAMIKDHKSAVALFERQSRSSGDLELKA